MRAEILTVGTEILLGNIVNTNSQYLSEKLAELGVEVYSHRTVGDNKERILNAFDDAFKHSDIVITTGGLGPTKDDITKECAVEYFKKEVIIHEESLKRIEKYFNSVCRPMKENNKKQAYFPKDAVIFNNYEGTAPGGLIEDNYKKIILLPGPPREMKAMYEKSLKPYLMALQNYILKSLIIKFAGIGESNMEQKLNDVIEFQNNPTVAPYAKDNGCEIRITAKARNNEEAELLILPIKEKIENILGQYIYGYNEDTLEKVVAELLLSKNMTISFAESCTGGLLSGTFVNFPGVSQVFKESIISYSNESKCKYLNVLEDTIKTFGAVSRETAIEMAKGCKNNTGADIAVSVTGIAGPSGGTKDKPVGLVWVSVVTDENVYVRSFKFSGNRNVVRMRTVYNTLNYIRNILVNDGDLNDE